MSVAAISSAHTIAPQATEHRAPVAVPQLPDMPKPVTPATAAGYLMQVPSSRVLEALASLQRVMSQQAPAAVEGHTDAAQRLAKAVAPAASGVKVDLEA